MSRTPLDHWHSARRATFVTSDGWQIPAGYTDVAVELSAVRTGLGLVDITAFAKLSVVGHDAPAFVQALGSDSLLLKAGDVSYADLNEAVLACCLAMDHVLLLASTTAAIEGSDRLTSLRNAHSVILSNSTHAYAGFCLAGPHTDEVLRQISPLDFSSATRPALACAETSLAGVHALLVRSQELSVPSVRICVAWDLGEFIWEELYAAGRRWGIVPVGLEAWRQLVRSTDPTDRR